VHANTGGWQRRAPRRATSDAGASAAHAAARPGGRVREPRGHRLAAPAGRPRSRRAPALPRERVPMRCRVPGLPRTAAAGTSHQRSRGTPASAQLAINCRRPARQRPTTLRLCGSGAGPQIGRAAPNLHAPGGRFTRRMLTGRAARAQYSARTRERRGERANWPPLTRPTVCVAWPSSAARRTQKAEKDAALRGVRARAGDGHRPRGIRRPRGHSVRCRRGCATRRDKENHHSSVTRVRHPPFGHHRFATFDPLFSLGRLGPLEAAIFCFRSPLVARSFRWRDDCYGNCMSCTSVATELSTGSSGGALR